MSLVVKSASSRSRAIAIARGSASVNHYNAAHGGGRLQGDHDEISTGAVMKIFTRAMGTAGCVVVAATMLSAQNGAQPRPMRTGPDEEVRHLVYIATPGDNGTDNQSGVVVLDADKGYSFIKRIPYGLPASQMPGPKIAGIRASVPLQMIYVAANGHMLAIDLKTDAVAWKFNGESAPVERSRGAASGCCGGPWATPQGTAPPGGAR